MNPDDFSARFLNNVKGPDAQGRPSDHALGVAYFGGWERPVDGFAEHVRRNARALAMAGCPVHLRSIQPGFLAEDDASVAVQKSVRDMLEASISRYSVMIHQIVIGNGELLHGLLHHPRLSASDLEVVNRRRVIYTVWERREVPKHIVDCLNRVGQVWVACEDSCDTMIASGVDVDRVRVVPMPYMPDDAYLKLRGRTSRKPGPPRFYHIGKWEPRKAQHEMLGSFMMAFSPGEAELHMKTNHGAPGIVGYPETTTASIKTWLASGDVKNGWTAENVAASIRIYEKQIPESQIVALHGHCDVYLSLSRGEGWDIPAFCAALAGNRMVYTHGGGPSDYATGKDYGITLSNTVDCHRVYGWQDGATYWDVAPEDSVSWLSLAAEEVRQGGTLPDRSPIGDFAVDVVGRTMLKNLNNLCDKVF